MDTSTNPLGCNPAASKAITECASMDLDQYPSTYSDELREELAKFYGLTRDNFIVGNGSDEMLDILFKTFMEPGETVITAYPVVFVARVLREDQRRQGHPDRSG